MLSSAALEPFDPYSDWPEPDASLVNGGARPAPALPLHCYRRLASWIRELAANKSAPLDYIALSLLVSAAGVIGAARSVRLRDGFEQPSILWGMLIGEPSTSKSPCFAPFKSAANAIARDEEAEAESERREHETRRQSAQEARSAWESKVKEAVKSQRSAPNLPEEAVDPGEWSPPRLLVGDSTIERLAHLFSGNPRGLLLCRDELAGLFGNFGKYGGDGDAAFYLQAFDGEFTCVDRVKSGAIRAERAALSIFGGIQPDRLQDQLLTRTNDGLVARFLPVWPDRSPRKWDVPPANQGRIEQILQRLRGLEFNPDNPRVLPLARDATEVYGAWYERQDRRISGEVGLIGDFLGKSYGVVGRLALVLELIEWAARADGPPFGPDSVSAESAQCAIELHAYFEAMARRTYGDAARLDPERRAIALLAELRKRRLLKFNAREARREWGVAGFSSKADTIDAACAILEDGDCIRAVAAPSKGPGRKAKDFLVNPRLFAASSDAHAFCQNANLPNLPNCQNEAAADDRNSAKRQFRQNGNFGNSAEGAFEERAAIREHDGGMSRADAETAARVDCRAARRKRKRAEGRSPAEVASP